MNQRGGSARIKANFKQAIADAVRNPKSAESLRLKKVSEPLIKIVAWEVLGIAFRRSDTHSHFFLELQLILLQFHKHAVQCISFTPNYLYDQTTVEMPSITIWTKMMISHLVAATKNFISH